MDPRARNREALLLIGIGTIFCIISPLLLLASFPLQIANEVIEGVLTVGLALGFPIGIILIVWGTVLRARIGKSYWYFVALLLFTVLLVVLVTLGSLSCTRCIGPDAHLRALIDSMQAEAEVYSVNHGGSYVNMCTSKDKEVADLLESIKAASPEKIVCNSDQSAWLLEVKLKASSDWRCVDSSGHNRYGIGRVGNEMYQCPVVMD